MSHYIKFSYPGIASVDQSTEEYSIMNDEL